MDEEVKVKGELSGGSDFEDALRTLASAAIERDSIPLSEGAPPQTDASDSIDSSKAPLPKTISKKSTSTSLSTVEIKEPPWFDIGIVRGTGFSVCDFYKTDGEIDHSHTTSDNVPDYSDLPKIELLPGTAYKFRIAAINSLGLGEWSDVAAFKTCLPGFPGAPCSIRISKSADGARLQWNPPALCSGRITEYSVCLAVKRDDSTNVTLKDLPFMRVYCGPENNAFVDNDSLKAAFIDRSVKPAIIFRIAARNEKGYGPATQVRWLQDLQASPSKGGDHKKDPSRESSKIKPPY